MFLGILGGTPEHWGQYCHAYGDAWLKAGILWMRLILLLQFMDLLETTIGKRRRTRYKKRRDAVDHAAKVGEAVDRDDA